MLCNRLIVILSSSIIHSWEHRRIDMSGYFYITCKKNGKVLDCKGNDKPVALTTLTIRERVEKTDGKQGRNEHRDTQLWKWDSEGRLVNKADNNLVADVKEKKKEAGTPVILWAPHLKPNQKWRVSSDLMHSELNDLVMDASDFNVKMSVKKKDPEERDMAHQTWEFIPEEIQYFYIISEKDGKVLDSVIDVEGQILTTSPRTGEDTQLWRFDGNCLVNKLGFVADVKENNEAAATPVILSSQTGDLNCCDIGQIDRFSIIELFPLSSCQVIILIARMTFNCSTSCLMN